MAKQTTIATTQLPPPPYQQPLTMQNGMLSLAWSMWIQQLFNRVGGFSATSNPTLRAQTPFSILQTYIPNSATIVFTSPIGVTSIFNTASVTNNGITAATLTINAVSVGGSPASTNLVLSSFSIAPKATISLSQLANLSLGGGAYLSCVASVPAALLFTASGVQVS